MEYLFIVGKGEVSVLYLAFLNAKKLQKAREIIQRLIAGKYIPASTRMFALADGIRLATPQGEWSAFLITLPPGKEEEVVKVVTHQLNKILGIELKRQPDMQPKVAALYTAIIMRRLGDQR